MYSIKRCLLISSLSIHPRRKNLHYKLTRPNIHNAGWVKCRLKRVTAINISVHTYHANNQLN